MHIPYLQKTVHTSHRLNGPVDDFFCFFSIAAIGIRRVCIRHPEAGIARFLLGALAFHF